jgi:NAD-dependent deacetylase
MEPLDGARRLLARSRHAVAFTGAGVSTASGVPDFRSPGGIWSRHRPVTIQEFRASADARRRYWLYKKETYADFAQARPNAAHAALARLEADGRMLGVITQNIDGLHQDAGSRRVVELHGTNRRVECLGCGRGGPAAEAQERLLAGEEVPTCAGCGGPLKAATISFGQALRPEVLEEAFALAREADLLLVLGSSLVVYPAAAIPETVAARGAPMIIINREPTPLDGLAAEALRGEVERLLPALVDGAAGGRTPVE